MKMKWVAVFFFLIWVRAFSQDYQFSQFYASPLTTNPALTGNFNGMARVGVNYRLQWSNLLYSNFVYQTPAVFADFNFFNKNLSWGIHLLNDQTNNKTFNSLEIRSSAAYHLRFWRMRLSFGIQGSYSQNYLDIKKLDPNIVSTEINLNDQNRQFDFHAGAFATYKYHNNNILYYGASVFHLIRPVGNYSSGNQQYILPAKYMFHIGGDFAVRDRYKIIPGLLMAYQGGASQINLGSTLTYRVNKLYQDEPICLLVGVWARLNESHAESFIPKAGIEYGRCRAVVSYDYTLSDLGMSKSPNTLELSMNYYFQSPEKKRNDFDCIYSPY